MQDHFIKNVNDLSLCMTLPSDRAEANMKVCIPLWQEPQAHWSPDGHYSNEILVSHPVCTLSIPFFNPVYLKDSLRSHRKHIWRNKAWRLIAKEEKWSNQVDPVSPKDHLIFFLTVFLKIYFSTFLDKCVCFLIREINACLFCFCPWWRTLSEVYSWSSFFIGLFWTED